MSNAQIPYDGVVGNSTNAPYPQPSAYLDRWTPFLRRPDPQPKPARGSPKL
jgi:hypothetical protein